MDTTNKGTFNLDGGPFALEDVDVLAHFSVADDQIGLVLLVLNHPFFPIQFHAWRLVRDRHVNVRAHRLSTCIHSSLFR